MTTPQQRGKARGRETENLVVKYLRQQGFGNAERRALKGAKDEGDITGIPGVVIEVKGERANRLPEWKRETIEEIKNACVDFGLLVVRKDRAPVGEWDVYVPMDFICDSDLEHWAAEESVWVRITLREAALLIAMLGYR